MRFIQHKNSWDWGLTLTAFFVKVNWIESLEHVLFQFESVQHSWSDKQAGVNDFYVNADISKLNPVW